MLPVKSGRNEDPKKQRRNDLHNQLAKLSNNVCLAEKDFLQKNYLFDSRSHLWLRHAQIPTNIKKIQHLTKMIYEVKYPFHTFPIRNSIYFNLG